MFSTPNSPSTQLSSLSGHSPPAPPRQLAHTVSCFSFVFGLVCLIGPCSDTMSVPRRPHSFALQAASFDSLTPCPLSTQRGRCSCRPREEGVQDPAHRDDCRRLLLLPPPRGSQGVSDALIVRALLSTGFQRCFSLRQRESRIPHPSIAERQRSEFLRDNIETTLRICKRRFEATGGSSGARVAVFASAARLLALSRQRDRMNMAFRWQAPENPALKDGGHLGEGMRPQNFY